MYVCAYYEVGFMNGAQMMLINRRIIGWMIRALAWIVRRMMDDFYLNKKKLNKVKSKYKQIQSFKIKTKIFRKL